MAVHSLLTLHTACTARNTRDQHLITNLERTHSITAFLDHAYTLMADSRAFLAARNMALQDVQV